MPRWVSARILWVGVAAAAAGCNTSAAGPGGGGRGGRGRGGDGGAAPVVTAKAAEKDVPVDLAAIGNVVVQARAAGLVSGDLEAVRVRVAAAFPPRWYEPKV